MGGAVLWHVFRQRYAVRLLFSVALLVCSVGTFWHHAKIVASSETTTSHGDDLTPLLPFCTREQVQNGRWIESKTPKNSTWYADRTMTVHAQEYSSKFTEYIWAPSTSCVDDAPNYDWQPHDHKNCHFVKWNPRTFCNLMKGASILFVGDALTLEHYEVLVDALGGSTVKCPTITQHVCPTKNTYILYRQQNKLRPKAIAALLKEHAPTILILNQGSHYKTDDEYMPNVIETLKVVAKWQAECHQRQVKCHFVWRTNVPGHAHCDKLVSQSSITNLTLTQMEKHVFQNRLLEVSNDWEDYQHQNLLVSEQLEHMARSSKNSNKASLDNPIVLDAYHLNILRPDQHRKPPIDCFHNCLPGKVAVYNQLLLHWLVQARTIEDVRALQQSDYKPRIPHSELRPQAC